MIPANSRHSLESHSRKDIANPSPLPHWSGCTVKSRWASARPALLGASSRQALFARVAPDLTPPGHKHSKPPTQHKSTSYIHQGNSNQDRDHPNQEQPKGNRERELHREVPFSAEGEEWLAGLIWLSFLGDRN